ncbi:hypothetical protein TIFTF001_014764 [Ficus carica]|uniref:Aldehyde dehydrogenase n=1 Tax=Ficus carica TaxID=3494 RepID=A0AA88DII3_FICCA|nr:hypothetical protein TIFTF001_014764 [Ficus carica]
MGSEEGKWSSSYDAKEEAAKVVGELRESFSSNKTRSYDWRASQLKNILKIADNHEQDILHALRSDLSKPEMDSLFSADFTRIHVAWTNLETEKLSSTIRH